MNWLELIKSLVPIILELIKLIGKAPKQAAENVKVARGMKKDR